MEAMEWYLKTEISSTQLDIQDLSVKLDTVYTASSNTQDMTGVATETATTAHSTATTTLAITANLKTYCQELVLAQFDSLNFSVNVATVC